MSKWHLSLLIKTLISVLLSFLIAEILTISCYWSLSIPPENIRKPDVFLMFSGVVERDHWYKMD